jgi:hypothetical protein
MNDQSLFQTKRLAIMSRISARISFSPANLSNHIWALILLAFLARCQSVGMKDIEEFYFPVGALSNGKLYVYRPVGSALDAPADYWYLTTIQTDTGLYLHSIYYDMDKQMRQFSRELMSSTGAVQKELTLYEKFGNEKTLSPTKATIKSAALYPFAVKDTNTMIIYAIKYALPGRYQTSVLIDRNRRYGGAGPNFSLDGVPYQTIKMTITEKIMSEGEGTATILGIGEEWWAKGIGRVYYKKSLGDGQVHEEFELREVREFAGAW